MPNPSMSISGTAATGTVERLGRLLAVSSFSVVIAAWLAGCASAPIAATPDMVRAEVAIAQAQKAGAGDLANDSLQAAQTRLTEAKTAAAKGEGRLSQNLVEESMADAQLADLTAQSRKASSAATEVDKNITAIRSEADRRSPQ